MNRRKYTLSVLVFISDFSKAVPVLRGAACSPQNTGQAGAHRQCAFPPTSQSAQYQFKLKRQGWLKATSSLAGAIASMASDIEEDALRQIIEFLTRYSFLYNFSNVKMIKENVLQYFPSGTYLLTTLSCKHLMF